VTVLDWLLDSNPAIRWQVLRDLAGAPTEIVAAERARVANEGWGARLLALQGKDGLWAGGALFPHGNWDRNEGQPWTATAYSLVALHDFGVEPHNEKVRRAVAQVREHCCWEHAGEPFFSGEVEPCINGMVVALGAYFDQDVDAVAGDRPDPRVDEAMDLLRSKQQPDGTWLLENTHPGAVHFGLEEGGGRPSRWNTLRALRVLRWYEQ
jgi:hypothetical protein